MKLFFLKVELSSQNEVWKDKDNEQAEQARVSEGSVEVVKDIERQGVSSGILECHGIQRTESQEGGSSPQYQMFSGDNMRNEIKAKESLTVKIRLYQK